MVDTPALVQRIHDLARKCAEQDLVDGVTIKRNAKGELTAASTQEDITEIVRSELSSLTPATIGAAASNISITAGTGLTGGGDLTADRTLNVKLVDAVNSTDTTSAATANAVKQAYEKASTAATTAKAGIVQLSSAVNSASETLAATPKAVKTAYDKAASAASAAQSAATAASNAQTAANSALSNINSVSKLVYKGQRTSTGTWTLSGLIAQKPVFIQMCGTGESTGACIFHVSSGEMYATALTQTLGFIKDKNRAISTFAWPSGSTLVLSIGSISGGKLVASQLQ